MSINCYIPYLDDFMQLLLVILVCHLTSEDKFVEVLEVKISVNLKKKPRFFFKKY